MTTDREIQYYAYSDPGCAYSHNEDFCALYDLSKREFIVSGTLLKEIPQAGFLFVLCDGMGGLNAGEVASREAAGAVFDYFNTEAKDSVISAETVTASIHYAQQHLQALSSQNSSLGKIGTTMTLLGLGVDRIGWVGQVGDSRLSLLRSGELHALTQDQTLVAELVEKGILSDEEARQHPKKHLLKQSLGGNVKTKIEPAVTKHEFCWGDQLLMTSDGLHDYVSPQDVVTELLQDAPAKSFDSLVQKAISNQSRDNITACVLCLGSLEKTYEPLVESTPLPKKKRFFFF